MNKSDVQKLRTMVAEEHSFFDAESVAGLELWFEVLKDEPYTLAVQALIRHLGEDRREVKVADIREGIRAIRRERRWSVTIPEPPRELMPGEYPKWAQEFWRQVDHGADPKSARIAADVHLGQPVERALIEAGPMPDDVRAELREQLEKIIPVQTNA